MPKNTLPFLAFVQELIETSGITVFYISLSAFKNTANGAGKTSQSPLLHLIWSYFPIIVTILSLIFSFLSIAMTFKCLTIRHTLTD